MKDPEEIILDPGDPKCYGSFGSGALPPISTKQNCSGGGEASKTSHIKRSRTA